MLALYWAMREQGIARADLGGRLGVGLNAVRKLLDPEQESKPSDLQAALEAVGKSLVISVQDAA